MTAEIGLPSSRAVLAFAERRDDDVLAELLPIRRTLQRFGGSHAQRDALQRTMLASALRSGRLELASALVSERLGTRESSVYAWNRRADLARRQGARAAAARAATAAREHQTRFAAALEGWTAPV